VRARSFAADRRGLKADAFTRISVERRRAAPIPS
jgi:hypothetical protein